MLFLPVANAAQRSMSARRLAIKSERAVGLLDCRADRVRQ